jgi:hypothetical protein
MFVYQHRYFMQDTPKLTQNGTFCLFGLVWQPSSNVFSTLCKTFSKLNFRLKRQRCVFFFTSCQCSEWVLNSVQTLAGQPPVSFGYSFYGLWNLIVFRGALALSPPPGYKNNKNAKFCVCFFSRWRPGLPDFSWSEHTKLGKNIPNDHNLYQTAINYTKCSQWS